MPIRNRQLRKQITKSVSIGYQLFLPHGYEARNDGRWPLILFLHGIKKRGDDLGVLDDYGLTWMAERSGDFGFIVVTPQCPAHSSWPMERDAVLALVEEVKADYRVDSARVYVTGFSMGGNGTWDLAAHAPELFAAAAPLSGWFEPELAKLLKEMPIWSFHGEDDDVVPMQKTKDMVEALNGVGGNVTFTTYPGLKHNVMNETYGNPELYKWLLQHRLPRG